MVVVRSPVVLDLTDGPAHAALSNASGAVISITPPSMLESLSLSTPDNPCRFLAAVRAATPQERRLALFLRPNEGESGDLILTVVTASNPKMAKMVKFPLRPLSLHVRVHIITDAEAKRPRHRVKFSGESPRSPRLASPRLCSALFPSQFSPCAGIRASVASAMIVVPSNCTHRKSPIRGGRGGGSIFGPRASIATIARGPRPPPAALLSPLSPPYSLLPTLLFSAPFL